MSYSQDENTVRNYLNNVFLDPIFQSLCEESVFTKIQLESLLIDYASSDPILGRTPSENKAKWRMLSRGKTRGAYNRTLQQARRKLTKVIASMLLAGYTGLIEPTQVAEISKIALEFAKFRENAPELSTDDELNPSKQLEVEYVTRIRNELRILIEGLIKQREEPNS